jgi:hypothetical protein
MSNNTWQNVISDDSTHQVWHADCATLSPEEIVQYENCLLEQQIGHLCEDPTGTCEVERGLEYYIYLQVVTDDWLYIEHRYPQEGGATHQWFRQQRVLRET